jgi:rod shape determining protein RodA
MEAERSLIFAPRRSRLAEWLNWPYMDRVMLGASLGLIAFSVFTLAGATRGEVPGEPLHFALRQGFYALAGIVLLVAVSRLDYRRLREIRVDVYTAMVGLILAVFVFGTAVRGSHRWIELPYFRFQPSELAKILLCVSLAAFAFERVRRPPIRPRHTLSLLGLGLAPAALVFLQPDLGTGIVLVLIALAVLFFAGVPWHHFAAIAGAGAVLAAGAFAVSQAAGIDVLHGYQQDRLTAFLHPSDDPSDSSYQVNQAVIAVGSGERTGRGEDATQTEFDFLPERHTDFVFAVIGERFGFLGAALVVLLYAVLLWRALRIVALSRSFYGSLIAGGLVAMLASQVIVNVGMNMGMMPVTGISLPLLSYGGSSILATCLALGLLQSIHVQARLDAPTRSASLGLPRKGGRVSRFGTRREGRAARVTTSFAIRSKMDRPDAR